MLPTIEVQSRLAELRAKSLEKTITIEELREGIQLLRADRVAAAQRPSSKSKSEPISTDDLLADF